VTDPGPLGGGGDAGDDLVDTFGRERLPASWAFQRDEHPTRRRLRWSFVAQAVAERDEERVRDRHHAVVATLAFGDEQ